jgi:hypothetical protein
MEIWTGVYHFARIFHWLQIFERNNILTSGGVESGLAQYLSQASVGEVLSYHAFTVKEMPCGGLDFVRRDGTLSPFRNMSKSSYSLPQNVVWLGNDWISERLLFKSGSKLQHS